MPNSNNDNSLPNALDDVLANLIVTDSLVTDSAGNTVNSVALDETVNLSWTVQNIGTAVAGDDWYDRVYISQDGVLDNSDTSIKLHYTGFQPPLEAGDNYTVNTTADIPDNLALGNYFLLFATDYDNRQGETDNSDNVKAIPIQIEAPNLEVSSAQVSNLAGNPVTSVALDETVNLSWTVENSSATAVAGDDWYDRVYISQDGVLDNSDTSIKLHYTGFQPPLEAGDNYTVNTTADIPDNLALGNYFLLFATDYDNRQGETDNSDNVKAIPIQIEAPNLEVSSAQVSNLAGNPVTSVALDETVNLSWTVENSSATAVAGDDWYDRVYISQDGVLDNSDTSIKLHYTGFQPPLEAGDNYTVNTTADIPDNLALGNYFLLFATDYDNRQGETDNSDNVKAIPIQIEAPNLEVSSAQVSNLAGNPVTSVALDETVNLSWTVENSSATAVAGDDWYDRVYISQDGVLDNSDTSIKLHYTGFQPPLEAGDNYTVNTTADIPDNLALGNYFLLFATDYDNRQGETDNSDNVKAIGIKVGMPGDNDDPTITSNLTPNLNENTTLVTTVTATDPNGDNLSYTLTGGSDSNLFTIDSTTGELSFANAPNFESPADANGDNVYEVEVTADDGNGGVDTQTLNITVDNVNETPTITSDSNFNLNENNTLVTTVTATDPDGDVISYAIAGGNDSNLFTIDSTTGELSFNNAPNFESPADADGDNTYEVEVSAIDGSGSVDTQALNISVNDTNEVTFSELNLSDIDSSNGFIIEREITSFPTPSANNRVSDAGDINGDGIDDVIIGAPNINTSYVVFGKETGFDVNLNLDTLDGSNGFKLNSTAANQGLGNAVSGAGDINGDGIDDLIISDPFRDSSAYNSGSSYVVFGSTSGFAADFDLSTLNGNNGFKIDGEGGRDYLGISVDDVGDVNGDGIDDLIVGANGADNNGNYSGSSYIIFGKTTGFAANFDLSTLDGSNGFRIDGKAYDSDLGVSVSDAGDVNGDGIDDLIVGASGDGSNNTLPGSSYVVFGKTTGFAANFDLSTLDGSNGFKIDGKEQFDDLGRRVSSAGDINGDGFDDLIVVGVDPDTDTNYVIFGKGSGFDPSFDLSSLDGSNGFSIKEETINNVPSPLSISSLGDFNGDGFDDIILGDYQENINGRSYVIFGNNSGFGPTLDLATLDGSNGFKINGSPGYKSAGYSVSGAGDFNNDGFADLMVSSEYQAPDFTNFYRTYVVFGGASNQVPTITSGSNFNLDENTTLVTTITATDPDGDNLSYAIAGGTDSSLFTIDSTTGELSFNNAPNFESPVDADGDNIYEVEVTADDGNGGTDTQTLNITVDDVNESPLANEDNFSTDEATAFTTANVLSNDGDPDPIDNINFSNFDTTGTLGLVTYNGDGTFNYDPNGQFESLAVGETAIDSFSYTIDDGNGNTDTATVNVTINGVNDAPVANNAPGFFNPSINLADLDGSNGFVINGIDADDQSGYSVSGAGDVNGDGIDDLIVGSPFADPNGNSDAGKSYVVFGSNNGFSTSLELSDLDGSNGFVINGIDERDFSGNSVSGAGDINGDGIDDLIIGAYRADPNGNYSTGESYVVFGTNNGFNASLELSDLDGSNGFVINGIDPIDQSGVSVSGAGDINGDGIDDLIIGARWGDPIGKDRSGQSYVVFGSNNGFAPSLELSNLNGSNGFVINGIDSFDYSGNSVSGAGDINGDGIDDLIIGAELVDPNGKDRAGESYVIFGSNNGFNASLELSDLNGSNGFAINGIDSVDFSGNSVSGAGDINGDGIDDLIIGASSAHPNGNSSAGESYVVFGSDNGFAPSLELSDLNGSNGFVINGINERDFSGISVSGAGDINGDGIDDLIIGANRADPNDNTRAGEKLRRLWPQ